MEVRVLFRGPHFLMYLTSTTLFPTSSVILDLLSLLIWIIAVTFTQVLLLHSSPRSLSS